MGEELLINVCDLCGAVIMIGFEETHGAFHADHAKWIADLRLRAEAARALGGPDLGQRMNLEIRELCDGCGRSFSPGEYRPKRPGRRYCPQCRADNRPQRDAERDYRSRQKAKKV